MRIEILCLLHFCRPGFRTLHISPWSSKDLQVLRICRSKRLDTGLKRVSWVRRYQGQCRALRPLGHQGYRLRNHKKDQPLCSGYSTITTPMAPNFCAGAYPWGKTAKALPTKRGGVAKCAKGIQNAHFCYRPKANALPCPRGKARGTGDTTTLHSLTPAPAFEGRVTGLVPNGIHERVPSANAYHPVLIPHSTCAVLRWCRRQAPHCSTRAR